MPNLGPIIDMRGDTRGDFAMANTIGRNIGTGIAGYQIKKDREEAKEREGLLAGRLIDASKRQLSGQETLESLYEVPKAAESAIFQRELKTYRDQVNRLGSNEQLAEYQKIMNNAFDWRMQRPKKGSEALYSFAQQQIQDILTGANPSGYKNDAIKKRGGLSNVADSAHAQFMNDGVMDVQDKSKMSPISQAPQAGQAGAEIPIDEEGRPDVNPKAPLAARAAMNIPDNLPNLGRGVQKVYRGAKNLFAGDDAEQQAGPTTINGESEADYYDRISKIKGTGAGSKEFQAEMEKLPKEQRTLTREQAKMFFDDAASRMPNATDEEIREEARLMAVKNGWIL